MCDHEYASQPRCYAASKLLDVLHDQGYVIVHPDDVPVRPPAHLVEVANVRYGWTECRRHIFGADK